MSTIFNWSTTAASNNSSPPDGAPEGMAPSTVNNIIRENMAQIRTWYETAEWVQLYAVVYASGTTFTITSTDVTSTFTVGRRVKAVGSSTGTIYGIITASSFSANTTVTVVWDSGSLSNEALTVYVGILNPTNQSIPTIIDSQPIVAGATDRTKKVRFEVDGLTTATTRVITVPDANLTLPYAGQLVGTATNDAAIAGNVGEPIESTLSIGSATSLTTATAKTITSISLTAGDWDVWGNIGFIPAASTSTTYFKGSISQTNNTHATSPNGGALFERPFAAYVAGGVAFAEPVGTTRLSLASTTTIYLVATATFTVSTMTAYGYIGARRRR